MPINEKEWNDLLVQIHSKIENLQKAILKNSRPFLTLEDAAEYLCISKHTLYVYTSKGIIRFYKLQGRRIYFKIDDLNHFILNEKNLSRSQDEIEEEAATRLVRSR